MDSTYTLSFLSAGALGLLVIVYYRYKNIYSYWDKRNIKGPRPLYMIGNVFSIYYNNKTGFTKECARKYGKVFGIYQGHQPVLIIADPVLVRQICIKDFDSFPNHDFFEGFMTKIQSKFITVLRDDHWRRVRALMSPTFTSGKMRRMVKLMDQCADDLVSLFEEHLVDKNESIVNLKETYSLYAMDSITTCCYSIKLERVKGDKDLKTVASRNEFVADGLRIFQINFKLIIAMFLLPNALLKWLNFALISETRLKPLLNKVTKLIERRRKETRKFDDYLQMLLEAKFGDKVELDQMDKQENHHAELTNESIQLDQKKLLANVEANFKPLSELKTNSRTTCTMDDEEILAAATFLLAVGLETTSNLLSDCTYALAFHKEVQTKLRNEVKKITQFDAQCKPRFDYEAITSCQYLDAVVSEALRLLTPAMRTDRVCIRDYYLEQYKLLLPKGSKVQLQLQDIMHDADYWPEPQKFNPERFMPENRDKIVPGSYCPFGLGPRHCLGMRFSLTETKLGLAKLILNFEFSPAPGTSFPPELKANLGLRHTEKPIVVLKRVNM